MQVGEIGEVLRRGDAAGARNAHTALREMENRTKAMSCNRLRGPEALPGVTGVSQGSAPARDPWWLNRSPSHFLVGVRMW